MSSFVFEHHCAIEGEPVTLASAPFVAIIDANALYPMVLRDTLLRAASAGFYQLRWSGDILDEMERNLVKAKKPIPLTRAKRLREAMETSFPEASVTGYSALIPCMQNDPKDRHVAAAAVTAGAQAIVTFNVKDFSNLPPAIEARDPDDFLCGLFELDRAAFVTLLQEQASALKNPPVSFTELLVHLERCAPDLVDAVRAELRRALPIITIKPRA